MKLAHLIVAAAACAILVSCGGDRTEVPQIPQSTLDSQIDELRTFDKYPIYWLGDSFEGLPVTRTFGPHPTDGVLISYGRCSVSGDGGCSVPMTIRTERGCPKARGAADSFVLRGTTASRVSHLRLEAGSVMVTLYADTIDGPRGDLSAVKELRILNQDAFPELPLQPGDPLPDSICERAVPTPLSDL